MIRTEKSNNDKIDVRTPVKSLLKSFIIVNIVNGYFKINLFL